MNIKKLTKDANLGDANAQFQLGVFYYNGDANTPQDLEQALLWFKKYGYPHAKPYMAKINYKLGEQYFTASNPTPQGYKKALYHYTDAVQNGCAMSNFKLAEMYAHGLGVDKNHIKAYEYLKQAVEHDIYIPIQTLADYQYKAGVAHHMNKNNGIALTLLEHAVDNGDVDAMVYLGDMYSTGDGVEKDLEQAYLLYDEYKSMGGTTVTSPMANIKQLLAEYYYHTGSFVSAYRYAEQHIKDSAKNRHPNTAIALRILGLLLVNGQMPEPTTNNRLPIAMPTQKEIDKGVEYLKQSAEQGDYIAIEYLRQGDKTTPITTPTPTINKRVNTTPPPTIDYKQLTIKQLKKRAKSGDTKAMCRLGVIYTKGIKTKINNEKSKYYFQQGVDKDCVDCILHMAMLLLALDKDFIKNLETLTEKEYLLKFKLDKSKKTILDLYKKGAKLGCVKCACVLFYQDRKSKWVNKIIKKHAKKGNAECIFLLSGELELSNKELLAKIKWCAKNGSMSAPLFLAEYYEELGEKYKFYHLYWMVQAVKNGDLNAMVKISEGYEDKQDYDRAIKWYEKLVAKHEWWKGMETLGSLYLVREKLTPSKKDKGIYYLNLAEKHGSKTAKKVLRIIRLSNFGGMNCVNGIKRNPADIGLKQI